MSKTNSFEHAAKLDSDLLRTFLAVTESGSFSRAANLIHRSQSAVSLQIKQLETTLGQAVFERRARGVLLTTAGEKLHPAAQKIVALLDETIGDLRADPLRGRLRIGIPDEYGDSLMAEVVGRFAREHPLVELEVRCGFSADFPEAVARGELDMAVHAVEALGDNMTVLTNEKTRWAVSRYHDVLARDPLPVALFDRACWWRDQALASLEQSGRRFSVVFSSESTTGISAAISAGVAIGVVSSESPNPAFRLLSAEDGFAEMPASYLVLESRAGADNDLARAMARAIEQVFHLH